MKAEEDIEIIPVKKNKTLKKRKTKPELVIVDEVSTLKVIPTESDILQIIEQFKQNVGGVVQNLGFLSTTLDQIVAAQFTINVRFKIKVNS
jgi:ABC-type glutathione transport system ATPase component